MLKLEMNCHILIRVTTLPTCVCPVTRTVALQAPLSMGFPRQESWSGLAFPPPGDLPDPGIQPEPPALAGGLFTTEPPEKPLC